MDDKGAGVMAAFGLPPSHDNDPERAVLASMDFCRKIDEGAFEGAQAAVGFTTSYCFCGLVGGDSRCEYTIHGPDVNLAARFMGKAAPGGARTDGTTRDAVLRVSTTQPLADDLSRWAVFSNRWRCVSDQQGQHRVRCADTD